MVKTARIAGALALIASVVSQAVHVNLAINEDQVAMRASDSTIDHPEHQIQSMSSEGIFPFADQSTTNCCGPDPAKSRCPSLNNQTKIYAGYPATFYCASVIEATLLTSGQKPTLEACAAWCGPYDHCYSIDWDQARRKCWLYKEEKAPTRFSTSYDSAVLHKQDHTNCPKIDGVTHTVEGRAATFSCSTAIDGDWSIMTKADSLLACSIKCAQSDGCRAGDFDGGNKTCKLITGGGSIPGKANDQGLDSFVLGSGKCESMYRY